MVVKMQIALIRLCKFQLAFFGVAVTGEHGCDGISAGGVHGRDLVYPQADHGEGAAGEAAPVGEFQEYIQVLALLDGVIDGFYAEAGLAAAALTAGQRGKGHRYQYSG